MILQDAVTAPVLSDLIVHFNLYDFLIASLQGAALRYESRVIYGMIFFSRKQEVIFCNSEKKHGNHMTCYLPGYYCSGAGSGAEDGAAKKQPSRTDQRALTPTHML